MLLLLLIMTPLSFAGSPPDCKELGSIITSYELDLQKATINNCSAIKPEQLRISTDQTDVSKIQSKMCSDLSTIEAEIENLKLQEAVLTGIEKLKTVIKDSKEKTSSKNAEAQQVAGRKFATSLDIAQSVELLLHTTDKEGVPLIQKLKDVPENRRIHAADLGNRVTELCKDLDRKAVSACNVSLFKPTPEAFEEINALINQYKDPKQVESWKKRLTIQKKKKSKDEEDVLYSFTQMKQDLGPSFVNIDKNEQLSKEQIKAIQILDEFETASGFSFVEDIAKINDSSKAKQAFDTFSLHLGDAILRQQMDVQSRISILWQNLPEETRVSLGEDAAACSEIKKSYSTAKKCLSTLAKEDLKATQEVKANLRRLLPALENSVTFADKLSSAEESCSSEYKKNQTISESCLNLVNKDAESIRSEISALNLIKERIGSEKMDQMRMRNFALEKWRSQKCDIAVSTMDFCEEDDLVSKEVIATSGEMMKIAVLFTPQSEAEDHATQICEDSSRELKKIEERLCSFFDDTTSDITPAAIASDGPTDAPDGGYEKDMRRDMWIQSGTMVLQEALNYALGSQFNNYQFNPYPYNYAPYNFGAGTMGIADTIMFNSRYYGAYGFYMPTPGYTPYQAFGPSFVSPNTSNFTPYTSLGSSSSGSSATFFNFK